MTPDLDDHIRRLCPLVDAFLPSEQEVRSLFGPAISPEDAAGILLEWGVPLVVIKRGEKGVMVADQSGRPAIHLRPYHRAGDMAILDVTGAGDAFCGGFAIGMAVTGDPFEAANYGLVSASVVIEGYGATYAFRTARSTAGERLRYLSGSRPPKIE